ncbi:hypothetical protein GCM10017786_13370 [Amycolatopsis deserti]|uniref:Uncharacterized protein n=1 Tax=Amycolatopsis deserti TaxID=185696 RepID=A0ABQ3IJY6_9PSEU|nr:hypothetical protein GCM10017786_13370 [Amycolatopsis deserti]
MPVTDVLAERHAGFTHVVAVQLAVATVVVGTRAAAGVVVLVALAAACTPTYASVTVAAELSQYRADPAGA